MTLLIRALALFVFAVLAAPASLAEGLVQLRLRGEVDLPGGHLVEVEVDAIGGSTLRYVVLHIHLAQGTTGAELAQLLSKRLKRVSVDPTLTGAQGSKAASLWIEDASRIHVRVGGGLNAEVSCTEGAPSSVRLMTALALPGEAEVVVGASTAIIMKNRRPKRGRAEIAVRLGADKDALENSSEAATLLWEAAKKEWVSDRPGTNTWRPTKMASGATITGVSVRLTGQSDWGLEVLL